MNQDIERLEHLTPAAPKDQINPMAQSEQDRRRRHAKELREKAEDEKRKDGKKKTADRLMLSDPELADENSEEPELNDSGESEPQNDKFLFSYDWSKSGTSKRRSRGTVVYRG